MKYSKLKRKSLISIQEFAGVKSQGLETVIIKL
jgi:hypothetical protein